jgi:ABC-type lipoprotein release transport system permease subunit
LGLGATNEFIKKIFLLHGTFISLAGCILGATIGTIVAIIQQKYGIVSMPGNFVLSTFPVEIHIADIMITVIGVCGIGYLISYLPAKKIFKN